MTSYWLARVFRNVLDYRAALLIDALRWPEQNIPRTSAPVSFRSLLLRPR